MSVYTTNSNDLKLLKPKYEKSYVFAKMKKVLKPFLSVHMGTRLNLLSKKNGRKSRNTVHFEIFPKVLGIKNAITNNENGLIQP